jgi:glutamine---fructose-6-phosphate transaminase (isomerizing)
MKRFSIYQEIHDQPKIWGQIIKKFKKSEKNIINFLNKSDTYFFAGCGSGYNASVYSKNICEFLLEKNCFEYQASELFLSGKEIYNKKNINKPITFLFSRSGNTTEIVNAMKHINESNLSYLFGITCYEDSYLFKNSDYTFSLAEATEKSVATTKSLTSMTLLPILFFGSMSDKIDLSAQIEKLPVLGSNVLNKFEKLSKKIGENKKINKFFILSNTPGFGFAREAKLKLLEMTLSWADCFNVLDFRHGPKAVVDKNSLVVIFLSDSALDYELSVAREMKELGGNLLIFGDNVKKEFYGLTENIVDLDEGINEWVRGILFLPIIQLMSYYKAVKLGLDPDNPKNLTYFVEIK